MKKLMMVGAALLILSHAGAAWADNGSQSGGGDGSGGGSGSQSGGGDGSGGGSSGGQSSEGGNGNGGQSGGGDGGGGQSGGGSYGGGGTGGGESPAKSPSAAPIMNAGGATGSGTVVVFTPVTVTQTQSLDFGTITSGSGGVVAIDAATGARSVSGGVGAVMANTGRNATFAVTGQANAAIYVVVDTKIVGFGGGITGVTRPSNLPTVLNGPSAFFSVGGALNIPPKAPGGVYKGVYQVAVNYP